MANRAIAEEELRACRSLMRGMSDYVQGKIFSKEEFKRRIAEKHFEKDARMVRG